MALRLPVACRWRGLSRPDTPWPSRACCTVHRWAPAWRGAWPGAAAPRRLSSRTGTLDVTPGATGASWIRCMPAPCGERDNPIRSDRRLGVAHGARTSTQRVEDSRRGRAVHQCAAVFGKRSYVGRHALVPIAHRVARRLPDPSSGVHLPPHSSAACGANRSAARTVARAFRGIGRCLPACGGRLPTIPRCPCTRACRRRWRCRTATEECGAEA
jgi:hypothetical protein